MMRSMNSAVSALRNHQLRMDVIGNNIANVNTIGFKTGRVTFKDSLSQNLRGASGPSEERGGINPQQVGLGMDLSSMDTIFTQGVPERTDRALDVMINGDGFFMVSGDGSTDGVFYTRAGNFDIDYAGNLVSSDGLRVIGYQADADGNITTSLGGIKVPLADTFDPKDTKNVTMQGNLNSKTKVADNIPGTPAIDTPPFIGEASDAIPVGQLGAVFLRGTDGKYRLNPEHSDSVGRETDITVIDTMGGSHTIKLAFVKTAVDLAATPPTATWNVLAFAINDDGTMTAAEGAAPFLGGTAGSIGQVTFGADGKRIGDTIGELTLTPSNGANQVKFSIDVNSLTQFESQSTVFMASQDGYPLGVLTGYAIGADGTVQGIFSNGKDKTLGQIATAVFSNPGGLMKQGSNLYGGTVNSGDAQINKPGSGANALLQPGALEMSNVDLGKEFTNMIVTQRGFQANSRIISVTDQMLEELVNLKR